MTVPASRAALALLLVLPLAAACKKEEPAPPPAPPVAPAATTPAVASVQVGKSIGADRRITSTGSTLGVRDTIYASVATTGSGPAVLVARWTTADGTEVSTDSQSVTLAGPAVTEFHITRPRAWPAGRYRVEILLNGTTAGRSEFEIR